MTIQEAIELFKKHQNATVRKSTIKSCGKFLERFEERFSQQEVVTVSVDDISKFLEESTSRFPIFGSNFLIKISMAASMTS